VGRGTADEREPDETDRLEFVVGLLMAVNLATGRAAPTTNVTSFSITGDNTYWGLLSDDPDTGTNAYADYRIDSVRRGNFGTGAHE